LKIECATVSLTIGSIYGPNTDDIVFFNQLSDAIKRFNSDYVVIGGDWNTTVDGRYTGNNLDTLNPLTYGILSTSQPMAGGWMATH
jgi:hypothetical protein